MIATRRVNSTEYANSLVVEKQAGAIVGLVGFNSGPEQWIQLHEGTSVPADTAVPFHIFKAAARNFNVNFPVTGIPYGTGLVICNSTTGPTKAIGAANCWFTAVILS